MKVNGPAVVYPMQFVGHRWLENVPVVSRVIELWPEIVKYTKATSSDKILQSHINKSAAFSVVKQCVEDPLILCKLHFFFQEWQTYFKEWFCLFNLKCLCFRLCLIFLWIGTGA